MILAAQVIHEINHVELTQRTPSGAPESDSSLFQVKAKRDNRS